MLRLQIALGLDIREVWPLPVGTNEPVTDALLRSIIAKAREKRPRKTTVEDVLQAVATVSGLAIDELINSRSKRVAQARTIAAVVVQRTPHLEIAELARYVGRDSSTLSHSIRRLRDRTDSKEPERLINAVSDSI